MVPTFQMDGSASWHCDSHCDSLSHCDRDSCRHCPVSPPTVTVTVAGPQRSLTVTTARHDGTAAAHRGTAAGILGHAI